MYHGASLGMFDFRPQPHQQSALRPSRLMNYDYNSRPSYFQPRPYPSPYGGTSNRDRHRGERFGPIRDHKDWAFEMQKDAWQSPAPPADAQAYRWHGAPRLEECGQKQQRFSPFDDYEPPAWSPPVGVPEPLPHAHQWAPVEYEPHQQPYPYPQHVRSSEWGPVTRDAFVRHTEVGAQVEYAPPPPPQYQPTYEQQYYAEAWHGYPADVHRQPMATPFVPPAPRHLQQEYEMRYDAHAWTQHPIEWPVAHPQLARAPSPRTPESVSPPPGLPLPTEKQYRFVSCFDPDDEVVLSIPPARRTCGRGWPTLGHDGVAFTVTDKLGAGATGCVVRGTRGRRSYAVKVIHKGAARAFNFTRANFAREKETMAAVAEAGVKHLVPLLMSWEDQEKVYFVMVRTLVRSGGIREGRLMRVLAVHSRCTQRTFPRS